MEMFTTSINQDAKVAIGTTWSSMLRPEVVVPIRPYTAALGAARNSSAIRWVVCGSMPVIGAVAAGVNALNACTMLDHSPESIHGFAASRDGSALSRWASEASHNASEPGRMDRCSSAIAAVRVRIGSTTTRRPPRLRKRRRRPGKSAAVIIEPLETSGLAPNTRK